MNKLLPLSRWRNAEQPERDDYSDDESDSEEDSDDDPIVVPKVKKKKPSIVKPKKEETSKNPKEAASWWCIQTEAQETQNTKAIETEAEEKSFKAILFPISIINTFFESVSEAFV